MRVTPIVLVVTSGLCRLKMSQCVKPYVAQYQGMSRKAITQHLVEQGLENYCR